MSVNAVERLEGKTLKRFQDFATHLRMIFPAVPMLSADVVWGNGTLVDELTEHPIPFTDAALSELERVLPRLTQILTLTAVTRCGMLAAIQN